MKDHVPEEQVPSPKQAGNPQYLEELLAQCRKADYFPGGVELISLIEKALADMPPVNYLDSRDPPKSPSPP